MTPAHDNAATRAEVRKAAAMYARDRYVAALLAPANVQDDLVTLAAFSGEIERIAATVSEPMLGEMRIQWWRDALSGQNEGRSGSPVADSFCDVVARHDLPRAEIDAFLDAQTDALYGAPPADDSALTHHLDNVEGTLFRLAMFVQGPEIDERAGGAIKAASRAYGLARIGLSLPALLARGRAPLPLSMSPSAYIEAPDWRAEIAYLTREARLALTTLRALQPLNPALRTSLLPVALVEPYLRVLEKPSHMPARDIADIVPVMRMWCLAKAHWLRRL